MIPISDENPTLRTPVMTYLILAAIGAVWVFIQDAGLNPEQLARSVSGGDDQGPHVAIE